MSTRDKPARTFLFLKKRYLNPQKAKVDQTGEVHRKVCEKYFIPPQMNEMHTEDTCTKRFLFFLPQKLVSREKKLFDCPQLFFFLSFSSSSSSKINKRKTRWTHFFLTQPDCESTRQKWLSAIFHFSPFFLLDYIAAVFTFVHLQKGRYCSIFMSIFKLLSLLCTLIIMNWWCTPQLLEFSQQEKEFIFLVWLFDFSFNTCLLFRRCRFPAENKNEYGNDEHSSWSSSWVWDHLRKREKYLLCSIIVCTVLT